MARTITIFDVDLQKDCLHTISFDQGGELVFTSTESGHFLKINPEGMTKEKMDAFFAAYKEQNIGQVSQEEVQAKEDSILTNLFGADSSAPTEGEQSNEPDTSQVSV